MTALSANRSRTTYDLSEKVKNAITGVDSDEFYQGQILCHNGAGKVVPGSDAKDLIFAGISISRVSTGAANTKKIEFEYGHVEKLANNGNITANHIGQQAYLVDDQTVGLAADVNHKIAVGEIVDVPSDGVLVATGKRDSLPIAAGEYTATLTGVTNVDSATLTKARYLRVGSLVHVSIQLDVDPTAAAATEVGISLPIPSAIAAVSDVIGVASEAGGGAATSGGTVEGDATNDRAALKFTAAGTSAETWRAEFTYRVL